MIENKNSLKKSGNACIIKGDYFGAIAFAEKILCFDPNDRAAIYMAAASYMNCNECEKAISMARKALDINSSYIEFYIVLAHCYKKLYKFGDEINILEQALNLHITSNFSGEIYSLLGSAYGLLGSHNKARVYFLQASTEEKIFQQKSIEYSNYLFESNYIADITNEVMFQDHIHFNAFFKTIPRYTHPVKKLKNRLRIGYISPDFHYHAVSYFSDAFIANFDKEKFEVYCYSTGMVDFVTEKFKSLATVWHDVSGEAPQFIAKLIYDDKIDILVDLAGHTAHNNLPVFAYKPAPIQITGIGYFNTTGLNEIDYFLTDCYCDPLGKNDVYFSEKLLRLPHSHLCYAPQKDMPDCQGTPCKKNGFITFGCFNNFSKITDDVLILWKTILEHLPNSKLILKSSLFASAFGRETVRNRMKEIGILLQQIDLRGFSTDYLEQYNDIDIALDTFPYPGGATTCEALYMGVPVISLVGERHGSRFGYSILKNIGLEECIVYTKEEYVKRVIAFAEDEDLLELLHQNLRQLTRKSFLMNKQSYMRDLEAAYQDIWGNL